MEIGIAMVYARALYDAASEYGHAKEVREELIQLSAILEKEEAFRQTMASPAVTKKDKKKILTRVFEGRVQKEVLSFLCILVDKNRLYGFPSMVRQYVKIMDEAEGRCDGVVTSVIPLTKDQMDHLEEDAGKLLHKKVTLTNQIDPKLIGGVRVFVDGKVIDASYATRLDRMARRLKIVKSADRELNHESET